MQVDATVRSYELSAAAFRKLATVSAVALYAIIVSGATVRLTASGLGCESWPGCEAGSFFPASSHHGYVEFGNRVMSVLPILLTLLTWGNASRVAALPSWVESLAGVTCLGTLAQAPLGLLTIRTDLHPAMVMSHFLLALVVLGCGVAVAVESSRVDHGPAEPLGTTPVRVGALVLGGLALVLVVTGTLATAAGPHPGSADIHRFGNLVERVDLHVQIAGAFGVALIAAVGYVLLKLRRTRLPAVALALLAVTVAQAIVGETQWRTQLPWGLVLVHVALSAAIWGLTVLLVYALWRPTRALAPT